MSELTDRGILRDGGVIPRSRVGMLAGSPWARPSATRSAVATGGRPRLAGVVIVISSWPAHRSTWWSRASCALPRRRTRATGPNATWRQPPP